MNWDTRTCKGVKRVNWSSQESWMSSIVGLRALHMMVSRNREEREGKQRRRRGGRIVYGVGACYATHTACNAIQWDSHILLVLVYRRGSRKEASFGHHPMVLPRKVKK
jgi:hypothetical protein